METQEKVEGLATRADWPHALAPSDPFSSPKAFLFMLMYLSYMEAPFLLPQRPPLAWVLPLNGCALAVLLANSASSLES